MVSITVLLLTVCLAYQVNCYRSLDANIWVPSFDRFDNDRDYLKPEYKQKYFGDDDDEANTVSSESLFENGNDYNEDSDLLKYKSLFPRFNARDYNTDDLNELLGGDSSEDDLASSSNSERDQESESHSSLVGGYQFVSGGAGEGKQHLKPNGDIPNKEEVKSDIDLPAYCNPPNPCPVGYKGEDCDRRPYAEFTAEFSKSYQSQQNCICDNDHNECRSKHTSSSEDKIETLLNKMNSQYSVVAKKSPRAKRSSDNVKPKVQKSEPLRFHVAKKSPHV